MVTVCKHMHCAGRVTSRSPDGLEDSHADGSKAPGHGEWNYRGAFVVAWGPPGRGVAGPLPRRESGEVATVVRALANPVPFAALRRGRNRPE